MNVAVRDLTVARSGRVVLRVPRLDFVSGTTTAVFGPNGAGKTTLLRAIAGLDQPATGEVTFHGAPMPRSGRRPIAYAFQAAVFVRGSVRYNLDLGLTLQEVPAAARAARIAAAARECGLEPLLERPAAQLSGGEAQRVNVARALALEAPVTLLDEPLAGIDRAGRGQLLDELPGLLERFATTTIVVTHDRDEALRLADHLVVLVDGRVLAAGSKRALCAEPPDADTARLLGFTVIEHGGRCWAVPPGGFRVTDAPAPGAMTLQLAVERVLDLGSRRHLVGRLNGVALDVVVAGQPPVPGAVVTVAADGAVPIIFSGRPLNPEPR